MTKPIASLSLDLDDKWSYLKIHGDEGWESYPSFLPVVVPRILEFLERHELKITFFIVGQDAALPANREILASIAAAGHEIGNHSFRHEPWLHLYSRDEIREELARTEEHLEAVTGHRPRGFRGPGYSLSETVLNELASRGYEYDASTFPTIIIPLARAYYLMTANLSQEEKEKRKQLGGKLRDYFRPIRPYRWQTEHGDLLEIPVTTMPFLRVPIHASYIMLLRTMSRALATLYLQTSIQACRLARTPPSILLHPPDFLGKEDTGDLDFFPGMGLSWRIKLDMMSRVIESLQKHYDLVPMRDHARSASQSAGLKTLVPNFS